MRVRFVATAILAGGSLAACGIDLFHSTDFDDACVGDPTTAGCVLPDGAVADGAKPLDGTFADVSPDGFVDLDAGEGGGGRDGDARVDVNVPPTEFCNWNTATAHDNARRACAWLGACQSGYGANDFGQCYEEAVRTYDCSINPMHKVVGSAHAYWDCLWQATTCAQVSACVTGGGAAPQCGTQSSEYAVCSQSIGVDCPAAGGKPLALQPCAGEGKVCNTSTGRLVCAGSATACTSGATSCNGAKIVDCPTDGGVDQGMDCTLFGAGCIAPAAVGPACTPTVDAGTCAPTTTLTCLANGVASGCPSGFAETFDCKGLLESAGGCNNATPGRPWDISRACLASGAACTPGCNPDGGLVACHRGLHRIEVACGTYQLGACAQGTHLTATTYQCSAP